MVIYMNSNPDPQNQISQTPPLQPTQPTVPQPVQAQPAPAPQYQPPAQPYQPQPAPQYYQQPAPQQYQPPVQQYQQPAPQYYQQPAPQYYQPPVTTYQPVATPHIPPEVAHLYQMPPDPAVEKRKKRGKVAKEILIHLGIFIAAQFVVSIIGVFVLYGVLAVQLVMQYGEFTPGVMTELALLIESQLMDWIMAINAVSQLVALGGMFLVFALRKQKIKKTLRLKVPKPIVWPAAFLLGISSAGVVNGLLNLVLNLLWSFLEKLVPDLDTVLQEQDSMMSGPLVFTVLSVVILAPILEEFLLRGVVHTRLRKIMPIWAATLLSSAIFGALHGNVMQFIYTFLLALLLALTFERTDSIFTPILIHFGFNLTGLIVPELLGDEPSYLVLAIMAAVGAVGTVVFTLLICGPGKTPMPAPSEEEEAPVASGPAIWGAPQTAPQATFYAAQQVANPGFVAPAPVPQPQVTPEPAPEVTPEPAPEPIPEVTTEVVPEVAPEPIPEPIPEPAPEPEPQVTPETTVTEE